MVSGRLITYTPLTYCYINFITLMVYLSNILYIHFIDIKGIAWGHSQVIGTCSHAIYSTAQRQCRTHLHYFFE